MEVIYKEEDDTYYQRRKVGSQTIELGINFYMDNDHDRKSWWNVYISIFNKRKDMYTNMDKKIITSKNPIETALVARQMFYEVEKKVVRSEVIQGRYDEITIFCTWVSNRRRDAYYKVLSRSGYDWGKLPSGEKCIMKTFKYEEIDDDE